MNFLLKCNTPDILDLSVCTIRYFGSVLFNPARLLLIQCLCVSINMHFHFLSLFLLSS